MRMFLAIIITAALVIGYFHVDGVIRNWNRRIHVLDEANHQLDLSMEVSEAEKRRMSPAQLLQYANLIHGVIEEKRANDEALVRIIKDKPFGLPLFSGELELLHFYEGELRDAQRLATEERAQEPAGPRRYQRSELKGLRGVIEGRQESGELVVHAIGGAGSSVQVYGQTLTMEGGTIHVAQQVPEDFLNGIILLVGYPPDGNLKKGNTVNLVVAPVNEETYTMDFTVAPAGAPGAQR